MRTSIYYILSLALLVLFLLSSCVKSDSDETRHPLFVKANNLRHRKEYALSAKAFEEYLRIDPKSANACYELATLYDDHLEDHFLAIYYYRNYLLCPQQDPQKTELVTKWLNEAEKEYYEELEGKLRKDDVIKNELALLKEHEKNYLRHIARLRNENSLLKRGITPVPSLAGTDNFSESALKKEDQKNGTVLPQIYTVKERDTLMKISREIYGDTKYYRLIFEANKDLLPSESILVTGQKLRIPEIPSLQDSLKEE